MTFGGIALWTRVLFFEARVADAHLDPADRAIALKYLVHLIGDLHQPLHTYGPFQGGNGITTGYVWSDSVRQVPLLASFRVG